jgi:WD40 repeat protein
LRADSTPPASQSHLVLWIVIFVSTSLLTSKPHLTVLVLWRTYGQNENYGVLTGHKGAVLDLQWSRDSRVLFSASADTMLASWDLDTGTRIRRYMGHEEVINAMDVSKRGEEMMVSGSDDGYLGVSGQAL